MSRSHSPKAQPSVKRNPDETIPVCKAFRRWRTISELLEKLPRNSVNQWIDVGQNESLPAYISLEKALKELRVSDRTLVKYRKIALKYVSDYRKAAKLRNSKELEKKRQRIEKGIPGVCEKLPDQPPFSAYEFSILQRIHNLKEVFSYPQLETVLETNPDHYSLKAFVNEHARTYETAVA